MTNDLTMVIGNDWDTTSILDNNAVPPEPIPAAHHLHLELRVNDPKGGLGDGYHLEHYVRLEPDLDSQVPIFPGVVQLKNSSGTSITIANKSPHVDPAQTVVSLEGVDLTPQIVEIFCDMDADTGNAEAYFSYVTSGPLGIRNTETTTLI